jgi:hypothetical protein
MSQQQGHALAHPWARLWAHLWPAPITAVGLGVAGLVRLCGGRCERQGIAFEACGGIAPRLLWLMNPWGGIEAITFGHVVIARDRLTASRLRTHEHVHVRQYERWGIVFPIAYLAASVIAIARGGSAYRDNVFEVEAFRVADDSLPAQNTSIESSTKN